MKQKQKNNKLINKWLILILILFANKTNAQTTPLDTVLASINIFPEVDSVFYSNFNYKENGMFNDFVVKYRINISNLFYSTVIATNSEGQYLAYGTNEGVNPALLEIGYLKNVVKSPKTLRVKKV